MSGFELPSERALNEAFRERGRDNVVMIDVFPVRDGELLKLTFESANSPWRQGIWMKTNGHLLVNQQQCPSVELWKDTAPKEIFIECHTQNGWLHLYNTWDSDHRRDT